MSSHQKPLGGQIRDARLARGLTQEDLASQVGRTRISVSDWERGVKVPSVRVIPRLAEALSLPVELLVEANQHSKKRIEMQAA